MNKIVREHYPVEKLPEDLRRSLPNGVTVRLTLEADDARLPAGRAWIEDIMRRKADIPVTTDDPVQRIRQLRDEWDD
jgi:hypothetical protein